MSSKRLTPIANARGSIIRCDPLVKDPSAWLRRGFDWDSRVSVVDIFSGAGGLSCGLDSIAGMGVVAAFERDPTACETHAANMAAPVWCGDVAEVKRFDLILKELGVRRVDILAGGPPCAGFSRLGKGALRELARKRRGRKGVKRPTLRDPRNVLFRHFLRAVRQLEPQVVLIENVPEMLSYKMVIDEITQVLMDLGYAVDYRVLRAHEQGVPQRRRRLFIVANRNGLEVPWPVPRRTLRTLRDAIGDLPEVQAGHIIEELEWSRPRGTPAYLREMREGLSGAPSRRIRDHVTRGHRTEDIKAFSHLGEGDRYARVPSRLRRYRDDIFADKYHRMIWDEPAWTVTAHLAKDGYKYIHPEQHRTISVREAARIQSFPDRFKFAGPRTHRYAQVGNAVPPLLARALGESLLPLVR